MKAHLECIPCLLRQASEASKMSATDEVVRENSLREVMVCESRKNPFMLVFVHEANHRRYEPYAPELS